MFGKKQAKTEPELKETEKVEEKKDKVKETSNGEEKVDEKKVEDKAEDKEVENGAESPEKPKTSEDKAEKETQTTTAQTEEQGNGISLDQVVTKDYLQEQLSALQAKLDAVLQENTDLKNKYEEQDFGNMKGKPEKNAGEVKGQYTSFEDYCNSFAK